MFLNDERAEAAEALELDCSYEAWGGTRAVRWDCMVIKGREILTDRSTAYDEDIYMADFVVVGAAHGAGAALARDVVDYGVSEG